MLCTSPHRKVARQCNCQQAECLVVCHQLHPAVQAVHTTQPQEAQKTDVPASSTTQHSTAQHIRRAGLTGRGIRTHQQSGASTWPKLLLIRLHRYIAYTTACLEMYRFSNLRTEPVTAVLQLLTAHHAVMLSLVCSPAICSMIRSKGMVVT